MESPKVKTEQNKTRLPSNYRSTTRECVYLVTRGHFRSRYKMASHHSIRRGRKPHATRKLLVSDRWPVQWAFASLAAFRHILVLNCNYFYVFHFVLDNKIWWWWFFMALCFIELGLLSIEVLHCGSRDFWPFWSCDLDLDLMTFVYEPDPYSLDIYRKYIQIRTYYVKAFESYRLTDRQTDRQTRPKLYATPLCGWSRTDLCHL